MSNNDYAGNFEVFLEQKQEDQPFCFWYGAGEPHRTYEQGAGISEGKDPAKVDVPSFLPNDPEVRSDILDYYVEIEWFDRHLMKMLDLLEESGELENTLVIVTSDNGMPFPRAKANCYEFGIHMPLAIVWPAKVPGGRTVDDLVGFVDLTATILDAAGVTHSSEEFPLAGHSLLNVLESSQSGVVDVTRDAAYSARERHSSSRWNNLAYPQRSIRTHDYLLIHNFRPERWPAGAPQKFESDGALGPLHGGYHDIDACPTLTFFIENQDDPDVGRYFHLAVDHRPEFELFDIKGDPGCLNDLIGTAELAETEGDLKERLDTFLRETGDPRALDGGEIFETYKRYSALRKFPKPE